MDYLPLCFRISGRVCLVVGGGDVALRKAGLLARAGAQVRVVAPEIADGFSELARLERRERPFETADLTGVCLAVAATDDAVLNARVSAEAGQLGIPVNVVDAPALCSFVMPAIVDRSPILVAISTAGAAPVLARMLRGEIEGLLPPALGELSQLLGRQRAALKTRFPDLAQRRQFIEGLLEGEVARAVHAGHAAHAEALLRAQLAGAVPAPGGGLTVVGVGPGDPDLLTLRAQRVMQKADRALVPQGVGAAIVDRCRRDALREAIPADIFSPHHRQLIVGHLRRNERLVWLSAGDGIADHRRLSELLLPLGQVPEHVPGLPLAG